MSHVEWAEENVIFKDSSISPIPGRLKLKYSAHLRMPFDKLDIPKTKSVVAKFASQSGKSLLTTIAVGKRLDTDPAFVLLMLPTKDALPKIMKTKINPNLKSIPKLWKKFEDYKSDEAIRNKDTVKLLAGGGLVITGSTVGERKSLTVPMVVFDEVAEMESGTIQEASERMKSYSSFFPKSLAVSTIAHPTDEICTAYDACECKLEYMFVCPKCETPFTPTHDTFSFITRKEYAEEMGVKEDELNQQDLIRKSIATAHISCPSCAYKIYQDERKAMIFDGRGMKWEVIEGDSDTATSFGFSMNTMTSYFVPMEEFIQEMFKCGDNEIKLDKLYRGWWNTWYTPTSENKASPTDILLLGNNLPEFTLPNDTIALYMGVDTQKDHFWCEIIAYEYGVVENTVFAGRVEDFKTLAEFMERTWYKKDGTTYHKGIRRMGIDYQGYVKKEKVFNEDTGKHEFETLVNRPQEVKDFVFEFSEMWGRDGELERIYATRGHEFLPNDEAYAFTTTSLTANNYKDTRKIKVMKLGTVSLKLSVMQSMYRAISKAKASELDEAKEYIHRLKYINQTIVEHLVDAEQVTSTAYINQLTSEVYGYDKDARGNPRDRKSFIQVKKDNHLLDTSAICNALAQLDNIASIKKPEAKSSAKQFSIARSLI